MAESMKQYEIVFLLKAALDSSMNQFSAIGGKIKELEEKVRQYQTVMRDIGAFQKQQAALQELERKYSDTQAALTTATQKFHDATAAVRSANQDYQRHSAEVDRLTAAKANEKAIIADISAKLKQEGADTKTLNAAKAEHQATLARVNADLVREKQARDASKKALEEATRAEKAALDQKNALQNSSDRLREKIGKEREALRQAAEALQKMGLDTKNLDAELVKLDAELQKNQKELNKYVNLKNSVSGFADQLRVAKMAADAILPTLNAINGFFKESLNLAADLEYTMSGVEAISGASSADMERLTAVAKKMGATTRYTALDAANALKQMALAGWEAEGMAAALPGVVNLAAAADEDLSDMTRILVDGMNAFGMAGTENARKFADVLAKAATSSSTSVAQLGRALEACQGTAGNLGYTIEDVGTVLAGMANNGIKASVAGTALNTLLTRLSGGVKTAEELMQSLGVSMYYTADSFGHASGSAKPLLEFINDLREGFKQFGDNTKDAQVAAYTLAGMRGMKGLLSITNMSDEAWEKLCKDVSEYAGSAEKIAGISMDNYRGQLYLLTSAWDALKTSVGEKFLPTATEALRVTTDLASGADQFVQNHGDLTRFIAGFTVSLGGLLTLLGAVAVAVQAISFALNTLKLTQLMGVGGWFGIITGLALAAAAAFANFAAQEESVYRAGEKLIKSQKDAAQEYRKSVDAIDEEAKSAAHLAEQLRELSEKEEKTAADRKLILSLCEQLNETVPHLSLSYDEESDSVQGLTGSLESYIESVYEAKRAEESVGRMTELYGSIKDTEQALEDAKKALADYREEYAKKMPHMGRSWLETDDSTITRYTHVIDDLTAQLEELQAEYEALKDTYNQTAGAADNAVNGAANLDGVLRSFTRTVEGYQEAYADALEEAQKSVMSQYAVWDEAKKIIPAKVAEINQAVKSQIEVWRQYNKDLEYLNSLTPEIPGLSELLSRVSDGSEKSMAAVRGMAEEARKGSGKVYELAGNFKELSEAQGQVSDTMAQTAIQFAQALNNMEQNVESAIKNMDKKELAEKSAESTIRAFIDKASELTLEATVAYGSLGDAAARALESRIERMTATLRTAINNAKASVNSINDAAPPKGFAKGTHYAPSGVALVGEEGPELVLLRGGEKILTATETRRLRMEAALFQKAVPDSLKAAAGFSGADANSRAAFAPYFRNVERIRQVEKAMENSVAPVPVSESGVRAIPSYASGTADAASGPAWIGERGPELLLFRGAGNIPNAEASREIREKIKMFQAYPHTSDSIRLSSASAPVWDEPSPLSADAVSYQHGGDHIDIHVSYHIEGVRNAAELQSAFRANDAELEKLVERVLRRREETRLRRRF